MESNPFNQLNQTNLSPRPVDATTTQKTKTRDRLGRGFASMDPQRQREIASAGGKAAHRKGTAHQWTSEEAREAGKKGGSQASANNKLRKIK